MRYKIGDKIQIKTWEELKKEFGYDDRYGCIRCERNFIREMENQLEIYCTNRTLTVSKVDDMYNYYICNGIGFRWSVDMIVNIDKPKKKKQKISRFEIMDI